MYRDNSPHPGGMRVGSGHPYDYANWGYIILYLVVICGSLVGNSLFLVILKKNLHLRRTPHFMLASVAIRDIIVTILVVPFVIDSQAVNLLRWNSGEIMCKMFSFLNYGTMATHAFTLVFLLLFLYFWYRKQEAYVTEDGQTVVRKTRMHKWAIPLAWVIGLGLAIPAGALAGHVYNQNVGVRTCGVWDGRGSGSNGYKISVATVFVAFILPLVLLVFPFIAILMQLCGAREPRLDPPHSRTAATGVAMVVIFAATRAPFEVYELMKLFHQSSFGLKFNPVMGTPYAQWTFETDIILNCLIYTACFLHPLVYFLFNPEYRTGLRNVWQGLSFNQGSEQRARQSAVKRQQERLNQRQYPPSSNGGSIIRPQSRTPGHMRNAQEPLLQNRQPQIMPAGHGQPQYYPYVHNNQQILFPEHQLLQQTFMDNSFERMSPQLPAVFEYNGLKYIDTARVEPKIAYSPEKTPPKTPETPHFSHTPFIPPGVGDQQPGLVINPVWPAQTFEMADMSSPQPPPIATSETKKERPVSFELENLEGSPGSTLRDRHRRLSPPTSPIEDEVQMLQESPGSRNRNRTKSAPEQKQNNSRTNGTTGGTGSRPISPSNPHDGMEIVITGRTRSRQDLCPDVPRNKFEHSV